MSLSIWLGKAGLSRFVPRFLGEGVTDEQFIALRPTDYARFGIDAAAVRSTRASLWSPHTLTDALRQLRKERLKMEKLIRSLRPPEERGACVWK